MSTRTNGVNGATTLEGFAVLVTGANSGVGFAICCRLIDEFLFRNLEHLTSTRLIIVITTRSDRKGNETIVKLERHLQSVFAREEHRFPGSKQVWLRRVEFRQEILDLNSIISIQTLARKLVQDDSQERLQKLDAIICNAGIGGWEGLNYFKAVWNIFTNWIDAVTYPSFKTAGIGWVTKPQIPLKESMGQESLSSATIHKEASDPHPPVGEVFCANVFGHYLLGHYLNPLISNSHHRSPARIIWMSSMEAYRSALDLEDIQGIQSPAAYESSKRLTDVLALSFNSHASSPLIKSYLSPPTIFETSSRSSPRTTRSSPIRPQYYLSHPGICATGIMPVFYGLNWLISIALVIARWLGSPWHPVKAYLGAVAPVWLALAPTTALESIEQADGRGKWGSGTVDRTETECVRRTWVEGWGWGGKEGEPILPGRRKGTAELTAKDQLAFEEEGRECWKQMENLRKEWEARIAAAGL